MSLKRQEVKEEEATSRIGSNSGDEEVATKKTEVRSFV